MGYRINRYIQLILAVSLLTLASTPAWAEGASNGEVPGWFIYTVIFIVLIGSLLTLLFVRSALLSSEWSLAKALSEEVEVAMMKTNATTGEKEPVMKTNKKTEEEEPVTIKELCASTSRLVAFMGMIVILLMFIGFGTFALYWFAKTGKMPASIEKVVSFLVAGLTLFAPYAVNKFASAFESLTPKK